MKPTKRERLFKELCRSFQEAGIPAWSGISHAFIANCALDVLGVKAPKPKKPAPILTTVSPSRMAELRRKWTLVSTSNKASFASRKGKVNVTLTWTNYESLDKINWRWYDATRQIVESVFPRASLTSGGQGSCTFRLNP